MTVERIAVIGGGIMGNGIAHVFAQAGRGVSLIDVSPQVLEQAMATIGKNLDRQVKKGALSADDRQNILARVTPSSSMERGLDAVDLVVEAVPEKASLKYEIFQTLVRRVGQAFGLTHCSFVLTAPGETHGRVVAVYENPTVRDLHVDLDRYPEIQ